MYIVQDYQFDFGFTTPLSIGDFVWIDTDGDGIQGSSERGLGGKVLFVFLKNLSLSY